MRKAFPKIIIATLFGIFLLLGGVKAVLAAQPPLGQTATGLLEKISCGDVWDCIKDLPVMIPMYGSYVLYILSAGILTLVSYLFDAVITLSIDRTFISKDFINITWTTLRDFSNMAFIFVLLYTGIQTILGLGNWRKTVIQVIIIALLINFSLFFTKVVIDAGNILAVGIYESIGAVKTKSIHTQGTGTQERDLSVALMRDINPQKFLNPDIGKITPALGFMLFILGVVVNLLAAWAFFRVSLIFIGRIIGFWFLMIVSPFAFISTTFPKGNVFQQWLDNLLGLSFVAPVFLFFLYLIMQVLAGGGIVASIVNPNPDSFATFSFDVFFMPVIMVIFIYMALDKAVSVSKDMAGGFGKLGSDMGGMVMGLAGGAVIGGAAMAGKGVGGKLAAKAFEGGTMQRWAASEKTGLLGAAQRNLGMRGTMALDTARNASWDARNVGLVGKGIKATGVDMGKGGKVGYVQGQKDWIKEQKKKAALMEVTEGEKEAVIDRVTKPEQRDVEIAEENKLKQQARVIEAQKIKEKAEEDAKMSATGQRVTNATTNVATQKTAAEKASAELEKLKQSTIATEDMKINAERESQKAAQALKEAEIELNDATTAHAEKGMAQVNAATATLARADADYKKAEETAKQAVATLETAKTTAVKTENERRRGAYAEQITPGISPVVGQVVGGVGGFMAAGPAGAMAGGAAGAALAAKFGPKNISETRTKKIKAIREGKTDKEKEEEDVTKMLEKLAKKLPKEEKKEEGGKKH